MQDWIIFLLGLLLAIPLSVLANILTPRIQTWFNKSIFSSRQRRMAEISNEYRFIKSFSENFGSQEATILHMFVRGIIGLAFLVFAVGAVVAVMAFPLFPGNMFVSIVILIVVLIFLASGLLSCLWPFIDVWAIMREVSEFEDYKMQTMERLRELGGNPEELDEIDKEFEETEGG
jgi:hypothetical protein